MREYLENKMQMREYTKQEFEDLKAIESAIKMQDILLQIEEFNKKQMQEFEWKLQNVVGE